MLARQRACSWCGRLFSSGSRGTAEATEAGSLHPRQSTFASSSGRTISSSSAEQQRTHATIFGRRVPNDWRFLGLAGATGAGAFAAAWLSQEVSAPEDSKGQQLTQAEDDTVLTNWSGTHECRPKRYYQPETVDEVEHIVAQAHKKGERLRCVGSALSPNGLAFTNDGLVSLQLLDKVLDINSATNQVKVQAGVRVQDLADQLRPYGLTLQNYASIREQTIGGFTQVSAHGTGAGIPPVDEQVVAMTLVTPGQGTLHLSAEQDAELFKMARVGLGALGVVTDVTLQCVPIHRLLEHTFVASAKEVRRKHTKWLRSNRHLKYLWIPYTDAVVVVTNNLIAEGVAPPKMRRSYSNEARCAPLRALLMEDLPEVQREEVWELSPTQLRDRLLSLRPLDATWVARVNQAEAEFWRRSEGYRVGYSDELLGFDCGGQQWVLEVCFPTGTLQSNSGADLGYMADLLRGLEAAKIPAPAPIEQRWSASSSAPMSPVYSPRLEDIHAWVGIIMYLSDDPEAREAITNRFFDYARLAEQQVMGKYNAIEHWAKVEPTKVDPGLLKQRIQRRYPAADFNAARAKLDPKNIMTNDMMNTIFPREDVKG